MYLFNPERLLLQKKNDITYNVKPEFCILIQICHPVKYN